MLEIDPNYVPGIYWAAVHHFSVGRVDEAMALVRRARQLDPLSVTIEIVEANFLWFLRRGPEAFLHYQRAVELEPKMRWVHLRMGLCLAAFGRYEEALAGVTSDPDIARSLEAAAVRAFVYGRMGRREEATAAVQELERRSAAGEYVAWELFAYAYLGLDDRDALLRVITGAPGYGTITRLILQHDISFDSIRDDPRFRGVLPAKPATKVGAA